MCRSALRAFKRRVAYANANYDRILVESINYISSFLDLLCKIMLTFTNLEDMVGWRTSSIRRQHELPKVSFVFLICIFTSKVCLVSNRKKSITYTFIEMLL